MPNYDFSTLSPCDFEELSRDLLQEEFGVTLESFKTGRDKGIDLRYSKRDDSDEIIVQCKHYLKSGYAKLKSVLQQDELAKIAKLRPDRYVLTTSVGLLPGNKDELVSLLQPHCKSPADILGQDDLNNLLGKFSAVERRHFKLWLPSVTVLQRLLHNRVFAESAVAIDEIRRQIALFVPTDAVSRALTLIDQHGYCLLTGIPGIGKTATARIIVAHHIEQDWEAFCVTSDLGAAFDVFAPEQKQVFLYDDFLGQTSLIEKFAKNEDQQLLNLIHACQKTPATKRLVLTTRDHLLAQAVQEHERLAKSNLTFAECAVELKDYTDPVRAKILVNHLYVFGIDPEVCSRLVESGVAKATLKHKHYNPRIVETVCGLQASDPVDAAEFGEQFMSMLDDPQEIWRHAYRQQLSDSAKQLLLLFAVLGNRALVSALRATFEAYVAHVGDILVGVRERFTDALAELEGNFIAVSPVKDATFVTYHNPSIKDFADRLLLEEPYLAEAVLSSCPYDEPLLTAARILRHAPPVQVTASALLAAMQRGDFQTPVRVHDSRYGQFLGLPLDRAESLKLWLQWIGEQAAFGDGVQREALLEVETFIRKGDYHRQPLDNLIKLYQEYVLHSDDSTTISLPPVAFVEQYMEDCCDPDDFVALSSLVEGVEGGELVRERLLQLFRDKTEEWLDDLMERSDSSEEAFSAITAATDAANALGQDSDFRTFEERAEEMLQHEEQEADMRQDEYQEFRYEEQEREREVDDILDSMRS